MSKQPFTYVPVFPVKEIEEGLTCDLICLRICKPAVEQLSGLFFDLTIVSLCQIDAQCIPVTVIFFKKQRECLAVQHGENLIVVSVMKLFQHPVP